jgi:hypothetical protein
MNRDYRELLDEATLAAWDGATEDEVIQQTGLAPHDVKRVFCIQEERNKRKEKRRGPL